MFLIWVVVQQISALLYIVNDSPHSPAAAPLRHLAVRERNHVCWLSDVLSLWRSTFLPLDLSWFKAVLTDDPLLCNLVVHPSIPLSSWPIFRLKPHVHKGRACAACTVFLCSPHKEKLSRMCPEKREGWTFIHSWAQNSLPGVMAASGWPLITTSLYLPTK